ncbi:hypothetical protein U14_01707 [Candidatus Moduliflexus flocculans]|uniref:Uncharacterized protein n=1 Tax=Candidatus Moduliflexus flocculans TaxID=1499966 RepID=A0A0S6VX71_9BACT|nr:hypothetical protein U14_01707 [Candidatus Moduliflexus flocculans]
MLQEMLKRMPANTEMLKNRCHQECEKQCHHHISLQKNFLPSQSSMIQLMRCLHTGGEPRSVGALAVLDAAVNSSIALVQKRVQMSLKYSNTVRIFVHQAHLTRIHLKSNIISRGIAQTN